MGLFRALLVGAAGFALYKYVTKERCDVVSSADCPDVRDAGPENMTNPPRSCDKEDEASDESFPASDPPATY